MNAPNPLTGENQPYHYWAFISYSHQDNLAMRGDGSGDHIQWANWLHEQLESFRVPDGYRDRSAATGEPMPERFFPAFRDETELPTSYDLGGQIRDALRRSRFLIVIASPRSASSHYVNEEVRYFRQLGRGNRILTLIVDGEPNVRLRSKAGWAAADDCFCPALVHPLRSDGQVDPDAILPEEPIAADVRVKDVALPCEMLASSFSRALLDFMKLKLIAGLMGVGLDELVQRDKIRQLEEARFRARRARRLAAFFGLLAAMAVAAGMLAWWQRREAVLQRGRAITALAETEKALYFNRIALANAELAQQHHAQARRILASCSESMRGWEWFHIWARADGSQHTDVGVAGGTFAVAISPGRQLQAEANADATITLRNSENRKVLSVLPGHGGENQPGSIPGERNNVITGLAFNPDGGFLVSLSSYGHLRVWDVAARKEAVPSRPVMASAGSTFDLVAGGNGVFLCDVGSRLRAVDWRTGTPYGAETTIPGMQRLALSGDGRARAWADVEGRLHLQLDDSRVGTFPARSTLAVTALAVSSDGRQLAVGYENGEIVVWQKDGAAAAWQVKAHKGRVTAMAFLASYAGLLTAGDDLAIREFNANSGELRSERYGHEAAITSILPLSARAALTTSLDGTVKNWNLDEEVTATPSGKAWSGVRKVEFIGNGPMAVASVSQQRAGTFREGYFYIWNVLSGSEQKLFGAQDILSAAPFALSPDGGRLAYATSAGGCKIVTLRDQRDEIVIANEGLPLDVLAFTADGKWLAAGGADPALSFWDARTGKRAGQGTAHQDRISALAALTMGRIASVGIDGSIALWQLPSNTPERVLISGQDALRAVAATPDGRTIISGGENGSLALWDAANGRLLRRARAEGGPVICICIHPSGDRFLTVSEDGTIRLWDVSTGIEILAWRDLQPTMRTASFGLDGGGFIAGGDGGPARLWLTALPDRVSVRPAGAAQLPPARIDTKDHPALARVQRADEEEKMLGEVGDWNALRRANDELRAQPIIKTLATIEVSEDEPHLAIMKRLLKGKLVSPALGEGLVAALNQYHESWQDSDRWHELHRKTDAALAACIELNATHEDLAVLSWLAVQMNRDGVFGVREPVWWGFSSVLYPETSKSLMNYTLREIKTDEKSVAGLWCELLSEHTLYAGNNVWSFGMSVLGACKDPSVLPTLVKLTATATSFASHPPIEGSSRIFRGLDPQNRLIAAAVTYYRMNGRRYGMHSEAEPPSLELQRVVDLQKAILAEDGKGNSANQR